MHLMKKYTKRLNLFVCPRTYSRIEKVATQEGRKVGSMARLILQAWADKQEKNAKTIGGKNDME